MATVTLTMRMSPWLDYGLIFPGHKGPAHDWDIPSHHHHKSDRERWDAAWGNRRSQAEESGFVTGKTYQRRPISFMPILARLWFHLLGLRWWIGGDEGLVMVSTYETLWQVTVWQSVLCDVWCLSILGAEMSSTISVSNKTIQSKDQSK